MKRSEKSISRKFCLASAVLVIFILLIIISSFSIVAADCFDANAYAGDGGSNSIPACNQATGGCSECTYGTYCYNQCWDLADFDCAGCQNLLAVSCSGNICGGVTSEAMFCDDNIDNDNDGMIDCADSDCANDWNCKCFDAAEYAGQSYNALQECQTATGGCSECSNFNTYCYYNCWDIADFDCAGCQQQMIAAGCSNVCGPCGNNILDAGEQCDDGNIINGDGCSSTCQSEQTPGMTITGQITQTGVYSIDACAFDYAGNSACASKLVSIDLIAPTISDDYSSRSGVWQNSDQIASLSLSDTGSGIASVKYCETTGCTPNIELLSPYQLVYDSDQDTIVRYQAFDNAGLSSAIGQYNVKLDKSIPAISDDYAYDGQWVNADQTITLTADASISGIASVKYCEGENCVPDTALNSPYQLNYNSDQDTIVRYQVTDNAGNPSLAGQFNVKIDKNAPTISDDYAYDGQWVNSDQAANLYPQDAGSGIASVKYCEGAGCAPSIELNSPYQLNYNSDQDTIVRYQAFDNAGLSSLVGEYNVKLDKTSPSTGQIIAGTQGANDWFVSDVTVQLPATDNLAGVYQTYYCVDQDNTCDPLILGNSAFVTQEGSSYVRYYSIDNANNIEQPVNVILIKIDKTNPTAIITQLEQFDGDGNVQLTWSGDDLMSGVDYYELFRNNVKILTTDGTSYLDENLDDGATYTYSVKIFDAAGNSFSSTATSTTVDLLPPTVPVMNNLPQYTTQLLVNVDWDESTDVVSGVNHYTLFKDALAGINTELLTNYADNNVAEGQYYEFRATSTDNVNHESEKSDKAFTTIDTIAPITTIDIAGTQGDNDWFKDQAVGVSFTVIESTSGLKETFYKIDNGAYQTYEGTFLLSDGIYEISYYSTDNAENTEIEKSTTIKVDTQVPETTDNSPSGWQNSDVNVQLSATDNLAGIARTIFCNDVSGACAPLSEGNSVLISTESETNYINYYSVDYAGNTEIQKTSAPIKLDKTKPSTTDTYAFNDQWINLPSVEVSLLATDNLAGVKETKYSINNGAEMLYSETLSFSSDREYILNYYSADYANNIEDQKSTIIKLDATAPLINITITPKSWAECAANGWFFWLIWFVDSGQVTYPLVHGCVEISAEIDASISGLNNYGIKLYNQNNDLIKQSSGGSLDFNFDSDQSSYKVVVEALDNANNYGTSALQVYEDDDEDYVPDMLDLCPTIKPAEGMDVSPKDGCPDEAGVPGSVWDKCINIYSGPALTNLNPLPVINIFTNDTIYRFGDKWYNFRTNLSGIDVNSYISVDSYGSYVQCRFDLKEFDTTKEKPYIDPHKWHRCHKYSLVDKDVNIKEWNISWGHGTYHLTESWKLDLDDGGKIRASQHYNEDSGKTGIHVTYENHKEERICDDACDDDKRACSIVCKNSMDSCNDACSSAQSSCLNSCNGLPKKQQNQCRNSCYINARSCSDVCSNNARPCISSCNNAERSCKNTCRDTYSFNVNQIYDGLKTISLYDILKLTEYI